MSFDISEAAELLVDAAQPPEKLWGALRALNAPSPSAASRKRLLAEEVACMKALGWRMGYVPAAAVGTTHVSPGYFAI